jgi:peptidyl-tRNA hydrolase
MFKMVFVINASLKLRPGKLGSQTAHAAVSLYIKSKKDSIIVSDIDRWVKDGQKKVVLKGTDSSQLENISKQANNSNVLSVLIRDAGFTHLTPGSTTVLGLFGKEDEINSITGSLSLYN